jgi:hypothetical protein
MVAVPATTPVTIPDDEPTVATEGAPLVHAPPVVLLLNVVLAPSHTVAMPDIDAGKEFTVTTAVTLQPVLNI